jgi:hypothetical protein
LLWLDRISRDRVAPLDETFMNAIRMFAFVAAVLITAFLFGVISYGM